MSARTPAELKELFESDTFARDATCTGPLGPEYTLSGTRLRLWAPTAQSVCVNLYRKGNGGVCMGTLPLERGLYGQGRQREDGLPAHGGFRQQDMADRLAVRFGNERQFRHKGRVLPQRFDEVLLRAVRMRRRGERLPDKPVNGLAVLRLFFSNPHRVFPPIRFSVPPPRGTVWCFGAPTNKQKIPYLPGR